MAGKKEAQTRAARKTLAHGTYHSHSSKDNRKAKGRNHDPGGEEIGQLQTGAAGRVRVVGDPLGDEIGQGRDGMEEQHEQGPVHAAGTREHSQAKTFSCFKSIISNGY